MSVDFGPQGPNKIKKSGSTIEITQPGSSVIVDNHIDIDEGGGIRMGAQNTYIFDSNGTTNYSQIKIPTPNNTELMNTFLHEIANVDLSNPTEEEIFARHKETYGKLRESLGVPIKTQETPLNMPDDWDIDPLTTNITSGEAKAEEENEPNSQSRLLSDIFYSLSLIIIIFLKNYKF